MVKSGKRKRKGRKNKRIGGNLNKESSLIVGGGLLFILPNCIGLLGIAGIIGAGIAIAKTDNLWWLFLLIPSIIVVVIVVLIDCGVFTSSKGGMFSGKRIGEEMITPTHENIFKSKTWLWVFLTICVCSALLLIATIFLLVCDVEPRYLWWILFGVSLFVLVVIQLISPPMYVPNPEFVGGDLTGQSDDGDVSTIFSSLICPLLFGFLEIGGIVWASLEIHYTGELWWLAMLIPCSLLLLCSIGAVGMWIYKKF